MVDDDGDDGETPEDTEWLALLDVELLPQWTAAIEADVDALIYPPACEEP